MKPHAPPHEIRNKAVHALAKARLRAEIERPFTFNTLYEEAIKWREKYPFTYTENNESVPREAVRGISHFILFKAAQEIKAHERERDALNKLVLLEQNIRRAKLCGFRKGMAQKLLRENGFETNKTGLVALLWKTIETEKFLKNTALFSIANLAKVMNRMKYGSEAGVLILLGFDQAHTTIGNIKSYLSASIKRK